MHSARLKEKKLYNKVIGSTSSYQFKKHAPFFFDYVEAVLKTETSVPAVIATGQQVHGDRIAYVEGANQAKEPKRVLLPETDGLITDAPYVALTIKFADCTPIVLYDPIKKVQASVHSGWRGTVKHLSVKALQKMESEFGCLRENILVYLGPSIDKHHYEVGPEVYEAFSDVRERDTFFYPHGDKYRLSMLDANISILKQAGLTNEQMDIDRTSTYTSPILHSARAEGPEYELNVLVTMMTD